MPITNWIGDYDQDRPVAFPGMLAEGQPARDVASKRVEGGEIAFGLAVGDGAADGSCTLGGTGFVGITLADKSRAQDGFVEGEMAAVIRKGTVWVTADAAVSANAPAYFVAATGALTPTATGNTAIDGAVFETSAAAGALTRVYLG